MNTLDDAISIISISKPEIGLLYTVAKNLFSSSNKKDYAQTLEKRMKNLIVARSQAQSAQLQNELDIRLHEILFIITENL